ncbi:hypothetical protein [Bosea sp. (in: a-proteobacteria)]|uniref:hypothetical protein n=1 Tax=Bosea sp. (in: a-proteobacteria) TaxID=1871050 RepID=UPI002FC67FFB
MFRSELPRIYGLRDLLPEPAPAAAYFRDLDRSLNEWPQKLKQYRDIQADLQSLDDAGWRYLKGELAPLLIAKHKTRGWQQLFDKLNQAKAYAYLVRDGCTDIRFISESKVKGQRTPDLEALARGKKVLCEVKTINVSDVEASRFHSDDVQEIVDQLPDGFLGKLESKIVLAIKQMQVYCSERSARRVVYIIVNFDDRLHEYVDRYQEQINQFLIGSQPPEIEVILDVKPAFYTALS